jgi:hypothetical protein
MARNRPIVLQVRYGENTAQSCKIHSKMNATKLTYADLERLQYVLNAYVDEFKDYMSESNKKQLENLKLALIAIRAQMEQNRTK